MRARSRSGHGLPVPLLLVSAVAVATLVAMSPLRAPITDDRAFATAAMAASGDIYIPASAHVAGAVDTNWRTDVEVHNPGASTLSYTVALLRQDTNNSSPQTVNRSLSAGTSERLSDILQSVFGFNGSAALRISPGGGSALATSRTYNQVTVGTYGQFIGGVQEAIAIQQGQQARIVQLTHNRSSSAGYRTNLGLVNCTGSNLSVDASFYLSSSAFLGSRTFTLSPYSYHQENKVFESVTGSDVSEGYVVLSTSNAGGRFFAYASVVDNVTGDPIYIPAKLAAGGTGPTPTPTRTATPTRTPTPTVTPTTGTSQADLAPAILTGWDAAVIPSNVAGTFTIGNLVGGTTTYIDSAVANFGTANANFGGDQPIWSLSLDGTRFVDFVSAAGGDVIEPGWAYYYEDLRVPDDFTGMSPISAGSHTLLVTADPDGLISEADETDNQYSRTANWSGRKAAAGPAPIRVVVDSSRLRRCPIPGWRASGELSSQEPLVAHTGGFAKLAVGEAVYVAASAHVTGVGNTNWRTDLELHNPGSTTGQYEVALLEENQANSSPQTRSFSIGAGQSERLNDVLMANFSYSGNAALRITPQSGSVLVTSRTYNQTPTGTYGQFIPGAAVSEAIGSGQQGRLIQLTHNRAAGYGYRTNIGFANASASAITVGVSFYTASGASLGSLSYPLQPYMFKQVSKIFEGVTGSDVDDGYAVVSLASGSGSFFAYASVVDNATGDPIFIPASPLTGGVGPTPTFTPTNPPGISVTVSPANVTLAPGASQQFTASVTGTANTAVTWSVLEGAPGGNITTTGFYTAPGVPGTYHVIATSQADTSRSGSATVQVVATATGTVLGTVMDGSGQAISNAQVAVGGQTASTNDQGYYTVTSVPVSSRAVVTISGDGYATAYELTEVVAGQGSTLNAVMIETDQQTAVAGSTGGQATSGDGGSVTIGGGTLVNTSGQPYTGTANVAVTTFDPSDPQQLAAFPGDFEGIAQNGSTVPFETYGFMDVTVTAAGTGEPLNLASGQTATIVVPIPSDAVSGAPTSLPQWSFNPVDGRWHEEGVFYKNGNVYEGQIGHFSVWNCDVDSTRCTIVGRVVDGAGNPVEGARVSFNSRQGSSGWVSSGETSTPADGTFRVPVESDSTMTFWAEKGTVKSDVYGPMPTCANGAENNVGDIVLAVAQATITLTWGPNPRDLDSHLTVPIAGGWEHLYYSNSSGEGAALDTDDTSGYGPEIFSIYDWHQGVYRYSVHHYSGDSDISNSGAVVSVIIDGLGTYTFTPPPGSPGDNAAWAIFDIEVVGTNVSVTTVNSYQADVDPHDATKFTP